MQVYPRFVHSKTPMLIPRRLPDHQAVTDGCQLLNIPVFFGRIWYDEVDIDDRLSRKRRYSGRADVFDIQCRLLQYTFDCQFLPFEKVGPFRIMVYDMDPFCNGASFYPRHFVGVV